MILVFVSRAFAGANYTIYLSREFLEQNAGNPSAITAVLLEEIGQAIDADAAIAVLLPDL